MIRRAQTTSILATKLGSISYIFVGITSGMATTAIDSDLFTDIYGNVKIKKNNSILTIICPVRLSWLFSVVEVHFVQYEHFCVFSVFDLN
jgi:hypothetical protein